MNWKKVICLAAAALALLGCSDINGSSMDSGDSYASAYLSLPMGKGLEVYCWRENEIWRSGLLSGTNRVKTTAEIDALPGISLAKMSEVLKTYPSEEAIFAGPFFVSRPAQETDAGYPLINSGSSSNAIPYLRDQLGLSAQGTLSSASKGASHALNVDAASKTHLRHSLAASYSAGSWVEVSANTLTDVDLHLYLNGSLVSKGYAFGSERSWTYYFKMPDQDSTLSFKTYSPTYASFKTAYPWSNNLSLADISLFAYQGSAFDIGPGGMNTYRHGTSADIQFFLDFAENCLLLDDATEAQVDGGYSQTYSLVIGGTTHSFTMNGRSVDQRYVASATLPAPSIFDYETFIPYGNVDLKKGDSLVQTITDGSFFDQIRFIPHAYETTPILSEYYFDFGAGIHFVDAKHFRYANHYYEIISDTDFSPYIHG
jgi:hypothetical protein